MKLRWLLVPIAAGAAAYYALFGGEYGLMEARRLEQERALEQQRLLDTRQEVHALRSRADSLEHDSAALERIARERYGLIREGERLYRFVDTAHANPVQRDTAKTDSTGN